MATHTAQVAKSRQGLEIIRNPPKKEEKTPAHQLWNLYGKAKKTDG
jgi:hypothetical protein